MLEVSVCVGTTPRKEQIEGRNYSEIWYVYTSM